MIEPNLQVSSGKRWPGWIGILAGLIVAALVLSVSWLGIQVFRDPAPFVSYPTDMRWAVFYAVGLVGIGLMAWLRLGKVLTILALTGFALLILIPILVAGSAPALLMLAWLIVSGCAAGDWMLEKFGLTQTLNFGERLLLSGALGWGSFMVIMMTLGFLSLYYSTVVYGILAIITLAALPRWLRCLIQESSTVRKKVLAEWQSGALKLGLGLGLAWILIIFPYTWAMAPSIRYDALTYHLAGPLAYAQHHGFFMIPEAGNNIWTHYADSMYTLALLTVGQPLPGMMHLTMGAAVALLTFFLAKRLAGVAVGWMAGLLVFSTPLVSYESATAYIDFFIAFYVLCALFALFVAWDACDPKMLIGAGIFAGIALGMKLTAAPALGVGWTIFILVSILGRQDRPGYVWKGVLAGFLALAIAMPWFIRDYLWTGDPFFPFGIQFFGSGDSASAFVVDSVSTDSRWSGMIRYLWDLTFAARKYYHEAPGYFLGALPLLWLPWLYLGSVRFTSDQRKRFVWLVVFILVGVCLTFILSIYLARYLSPFYPFMAIGAALNLEVIRSWLTKNPKGKILLPLAFAGLLLYLFGNRLALTVRAYDLSERAPYRLLLGREKPEDFLRRSLAVYPAYEYLDQQGTGEHRVLSVGNEFRLYTRSNIDGVWNSDTAYKLLRNASGAEDVAAKIAQAGYDYLLINRREQAFHPEKYEFDSLSSDFLARFAELDYVMNGIYLYRLYPQGRPGVSTSANHLVNPGFEKTDPDGMPEGWQVTGKAVVEMDPDLVRSNLASLRLVGSGKSQSYGYVSQDVATDLPGIYTLVYWVKVDQAATVQMQVFWLNDSLQVVRQDYEYVPATVEKGWNRLQFSTNAPEQGRYARVFASLNGQGVGWFDDLCFISGDECP